jgi:hypothetical protein
MGSLIGTAASLIATFGGMGAVAFAVNAVTSAIEEGRVTTENAAQSARDYAAAMNLAQDAVNGVATATYKLADANKQAAVTALQKAIADNNTELNRLKNPSISTRIGRELLPGYGTYLNEKDQKSAVEIADRNAKLLKESIALTLSDNKAQSEAQKIIDQALPKETRLAEIRADKLKLQRQLAAGEGDAAQIQRALTALDKEAAEVEAGHTRVKHAHIKAIRDQRDGLADLTRAADAYLSSTGKAVAEEALTPSQRQQREGDIAFLEAEAAGNHALALSIAEVTAARVKQLEAQAGLKELEAANEARTKGITGARRPIRWAT